MSDRVKALLAPHDPICTEPEVTRSKPDDEANSRLVAQLLEALRAAGFECHLDQVSLH
jgi:hypothetical protein